MSTTEVRPEAPESGPPGHPGSRKRVIAIVVAAVVVVAAAAAYWFLLRPDEAAAVEATVRESIAAENTHDADAFLALWTDEGLSAYDSGTREEIESNPERLGQDEITDIDVVETSVDGNTAAAVVHGTIEPVVYEVSFALVKEDGRWLMNGFEFLGSPEVPAGTPTIDVTLDEFSFSFDEAALSEGFRAVAYTNAGEQEHEVILSRFVDDDLTTADVLEEMADAEGPDDEPEGLEHVGFLGFVGPGDSGSALLSGPLADGRYLMFCMIPDAGDPAETPHALKGMTAEFTIGD